MVLVHEIYNCDSKKWNIYLNVYKMISSACIDLKFGIDVENDVCTNCCHTLMSSMSKQCTEQSSLIDVYSEWFQVVQYSYKRKCNSTLNDSVAKCSHGKG